VADLRRRTLGSSSIEVPVVGIGCNNFGGRIDEERSARVIEAALDEGVAFFDTADIYSAGRSEEIIGRTLEGRRDRAVIATKFGGAMGSPDRRGGSRRWITEAVEDSLRRLRTDHIDLYQHHYYDDSTPLDETLGALHDLVGAGTVRAIGCSNYTGPQIEQAHDIARTRGWTQYVIVQNQYSLLHRRDLEDDVVPVCQRLGIGILPYFPLAHGLLTGKYRRGQEPPAGTRLAGNSQRAAALMTDQNFEVVEALDGFARSRGVELLDVAVGSLAAQPSVVSVIAGATTAEQVSANARAGRWVPSAEDMAEIDRITTTRPHPGASSP